MSVKFTCGCFRMVLLTKHYAIKFPNWRYGWRAFLQGLICNMNERGMWSAFNNPDYPEFKSDAREKLCPILYANRFGFFVIMPRAAAIPDGLNDTEYDSLLTYTESDGQTFKLPVERKAESWGRLDGRIVAIDYGD